jgi:hypothetical protein
MNQPKTKREVEQRLEAIDFQAELSRETAQFRPDARGPKHRIAALRAEAARLRDLIPTLPE